MHIKISTPSIKAVFIFLFLISVKSHAQVYKNELGLMVDNDVFIAFRQDRYYTNGIFGYFRHALKHDSLSKFEKKIIAFEIGQKIYNPYRPNVPDRNMQDRPFAGYLYGGTTLSWFKKDESVIKASVQVGILGPASLAKEVQTSFHKYILHTYLYGRRMAIPGEQ